MGRRQRDMSCLKPFCYYCQKTFKNEVILHHHQKAKHFSCLKCPKKFSSIDSMIKHCKGSHDFQVDRVPNANMGKDNITMKIFGMQGVPRIEVESWITKNVNRYWGRIIDKQNKAKKKLQKENEKMLFQEEKKLDMIEENNQEEEVAQNAEFPLEFNIPND